jgi:uncharacterized membrane protein
MLGAIRPDSWNFPLLLHVVGASVLLGALITAVSAQLLAWKRASPADVLPYARLSFRTLLFVAIPAWILTWLGGEWVASKGWGDVEPEPAWLGIGYMSVFFGGFLLLITVILAGVGARRLGGSDGKRGATLVRVATVLTVLLVIAYMIATWAMSAKPD